MKRMVWIVFSLQSLGRPADPWFGADKVKHFFLGAFVQSAAFGGLQAAGVDRTGALMGASAVSAGAVVAKEIRDRAVNGTPSLKDGAWGLAGAAAVSPLLMRVK